uniref:Uncharacterized protein n=1 Tax=Panagrolaimus davidi TaxID=227884 RepID=A0A914P6X2_9BILA
MQTTYVRQVYKESTDRAKTYEAFEKRLVVIKEVTDEILDALWEINDFGDLYQILKNRCDVLEAEAKEIQRILDKKSQKDKKDAEAAKKRAQEEAANEVYTV